jgi:hypothetical protein
MPAAAAIRANEDVALFPGHIDHLAVGAKNEVAGQVAS